MHNIPPSLRTKTSRSRLRATALTAALLVMCLTNIMARDVSLDARPRGRPSKGQIIAFVNVNVIPMDRERVLRGQTVITQGAKIIKLGGYERTRIPKGALIVDGQGKYLMPGLSDLHIHLQTPDELLAYLANGITTVLHMGGAAGGAPDLLRYRRELASGKMLGPALYLTGPLIDGPRPIFPKLAIATKTREEGRRVVSDHKKAGYNFIKIYSLLAPDVYLALMEEAGKQKIPVVGHIPQGMKLADALKAGQVMIAHSSIYTTEFFDASYKFKPDEKKIPGLVRATFMSGAFMQPTLVASHAGVRNIDHFEELFNDPEIKYLHSEVVQRWRRNNPHKLPNFGQFLVLETFPWERRIVKALNDGGVPLLLGTDANYTGVFPGKSAHQELRLLVDVGLTPFQALSTGTRNADQFLARYAPSGERFGSVAVGRRADLILLGANPLEDISNTSHILGVMVQGKWLTKAELDERRNELARRYKASN